MIQTCDGIIHAYFKISEKDRMEVVPYSVMIIDYELVE